MKAARKDHYDCVDLLIQAGVDVNQPSNDGSTPLTSAAFFGSRKSLEKLLSAGADVNAQTNSAISALMKASASGYKECVSLLREAGADVNAVNNMGNTALTIAAVRENVSVAKRLLKANCYINRASGMVQNVLSCRLEHGQPINRHIARLLFAAGEILDDGDSKEKLLSVLQLTDVKMELKHICREVIRKHLLDLDPHQHLFYRVPELGLPGIINEYLLYDESLEENESEQ